jgi:hypothetical protein
MGLVKTEQALPDVGKSGSLLILFKFAANVSTADLPQHI